MIKYIYELGVAPTETGRTTLHETSDPATVHGAMKEARANRFRLKKLVVEPPYVTKRYEGNFK